jgi:DNA replication protein DnaC
MDWVCPYDICDGSGFVEAGERTVAPCRCRPELIARKQGHQLQDRLGKAIPRRFNQELAWDRHPLAEIADLHPAAAREVRRYCDRIAENLEQGRGLWLFGNKGTGKTTLAYMVARTALDQGSSVLSLNTVDLFNRLRESYGEGGRWSTAEIIDGAASVDLLHLEDLTAPRDSDWMIEQLYTIVNFRYEAGRAILFTSDLPSGEPPQPVKLAERVGERTYSRLVQMVGDPEVLVGDDMRLSSVA